MRRLGAVVAIAVGIAAALAVASAPDTTPPGATSTPRSTGTATPTTSTPTAVPSPTAAAGATPAASPTFPPPRSDAGRGVGQIRPVTFDDCTFETCGLEAADETWVVISRSGPVLEAVDVNTGARQTIPIEAGAGGLHVAGGVAVFFTSEDAPDGSPGSWSVWRVDLTSAAPSPAKLDEFDAFILGGGDTLDPWPNPRTNGRDVVWLRVRDEGTAYELVVSRGGAVPIVLERSPRHIFYAIDDIGRIATAGLGPAGSDVVLRVYEPLSGTATELARQPVEQGGLVSWSNGQVVWFDGYGTVRPADGAELYDPQTGARTEFVPGQGCHLLFQTTIRHLIVLCGDGPQIAHDLKTGETAPLAPVVLAEAHGLLMRSGAEFAAGAGAYLHAPVLP